MQDAYSLRCVPQIHGASRDTWDFAQKTFLCEVNAATDNPLIFPETGEVISGGNFHGQHLAFASDFLSIAMSEIGNVSERRIDNLIHPRLYSPAPFLVKNQAEGLYSGHMASQYTAAALVNENKVYANPASTDSIPTSGNQEDHVSMGATAARKLLHILENLKHILAIELLCAAQALEFQKPLKAGKGVDVAYRLIRRHVPPMNRDRIINKDIDAITPLITSNQLLQAVEKALGPLQ